MILKVARLGYPVLRAMAQSVAPERINTPEFQRLLDDMRQTNEFESATLLLHLREAANEDADAAGVEAGDF